MCGSGSLWVLLMEWNILVIKNGITAKDELRVFYICHLTAFRLLLQLLNTMICKQFMITEVAAILEVKYAIFQNKIAIIMNICKDFQVCFTHKY